MTTRLPLILLTLISLPFAAQKARGDEKGITLRLLACEVTKEPAKVFLETGASKSAVIELPSSGLSGPLPVSSRSVKVKAPEGDVPLCEITLPGEGKSFAVLLARQEPGGFVPVVIRLDDGSFKAGDYFFVNRSANTVLLELGGTEVILEAGDAVKSRPTEPVNDHHYNVTMSSRSESGDKVFASSRWPLESGNRSYVIILNAPNGRTTYRAVDEYVE
jgi:hypothetical protein